MRQLRLFFVSLFLLAACHGFSQKQTLGEKVRAYTKTKQAKIGVAVLPIGGNSIVLVSNNQHYPMQSVYKFHLALAVLHDIDEGKATLGQKIPFTKAEVPENTWSPLQKKYPEGSSDLSLAELIIYMVSLSDNNACDILFKWYGGPKKVEEYLRKNGFKNISIKATEAQMHKKAERQYENWATPQETVKILQQFYEGKLLSESGTKFLMNAMTDSSNAGDRIKGQLPKEIVVAHKTGTSGRNKAGVKAATNDIGIIEMPNGKPIAIAVFVSDSKEKDETNTKIIADIAKMVFDFYNK